MTTDKDTQSNYIDALDENKNFFIKKCSLEDLEGVIAVNERELPEDYPFFFYKSILDNFPESFLVACLKTHPNIIVGYIMWRIERVPSKDSLRLINKGHLVSIAVLADYRRFGIASALLSKSMPEILKRNINEYVLEVRISNDPAINLYKGFRFKVDGIKKKYYKDNNWDYYFGMCC